MKKLVLFGDSLLKGFYKEMCEEIETETRLDIYNCAVGGWRTDDGIKKASYIAQLKPDYVIFSFGTNDAAPWKQIELNEYKQNLKTIFDSFGSVKQLFLLPPPINEAQLLHGENQRTNVLQKQYAETARHMCATNSVAVIDTWELFEPLLNGGREFQEDGVHFNDLGDELLTKEVVRVLTSFTT